MDKKEARAILDEEIGKLRKESYTELCKRRDNKEPEVKEITGKSGTEYCLEIICIWDDPKSSNGNLRVMCCIDDGGWRAFIPLGDSFIMAPDGSFVGEE
jgi:hypothetical protein